MENKEKIIDELLNFTKIDLSIEERAKFVSDLDKIVNAVKIFDNFDLTNIKPSARAFIEYNIDNLREDDVVENNTWHVAKNSKNYDIDKDLFILIEKDGGSNV